MKESLAAFLLNSPGLHGEDIEKTRNYIREQLGIDPDSVPLGGEFWTDENRKIFEETRKMLEELFGPEI